MYYHGLCSSRQCNICLFLQADESISKDETGTEKLTSMKLKTFHETNTKKKVALTNPFTLLSCSNCHLTVYCGVNHQRLDWQQHRQICRATRNILTSLQAKHPYALNEDDETPKTAEEIERSIVKLKLLLAQKLQRPLNFYEEELTSFPAYCAVCFSFKKLRKICSFCKAVTYCNESHAEEDAVEHKKICKLLQLYYCSYKMLPYSSENNKIEFFNSVNLLKENNLMEVFCKASSQKVSLNIPIHSLHDYYNLSQAADLSCIATVCFVLEQIPRRENSEEEETFNIFIIGANLEHTLWFREEHTRFFFLQFPKLTCLNLYFIGPEINNTEEAYTKNLSYFLLEKQRQVFYNLYVGLFQDFVVENSVIPSLIIAFNCGFAEYSSVDIENKTTKLDESLHHSSTWKTGISEMLKFQNVPIAFTSFTKKEALSDYDEIIHISKKFKSSISIKSIIKLCKNPFRDLRPLRNWEISDSIDVIFYRNAYIQMITANAFNYHS